MGPWDAGGPRSPSPEGPRDRARHCGSGWGTDCSTAAEGAARSVRPGNPDKPQWCLLTPARRREGVPGLQAPRGGARLRTPRSALGSPEASDLQERASSVLLTDREAPGIQIPAGPAPPALARRRQPRRA